MERGATRRNMTSRPAARYTAVANLSATLQLGGWLD
jgi:hypothetical protein